MNEPCRVPRDRRDGLAWEHKDMPVGQSRLIRCPVCDGGKTYEHSFSITRYSDGFGYICFRASCGARGRIDYYASPGELVSPPGFLARPYEGPLCMPIPGSDVHQGLRRIAPGYDDPGISILASTYDVRGAPDRPDLQYFMVRDFHANRLGAITRHRETNHRVVKTWRERPGAMFSVYREWDHPLTSTLWVVEDCLSAMRIHKFGLQSAVALLGTGVQDMVASAITAARPQQVIVALDPGAEKAAHHAVHKLRNNFGLNAIQAIIPDDIHRLDYKTFHSVIRHYGKA